VLLLLLVLVLVTPIVRV